MKSILKFMTCLSLSTFIFFAAQAQEVASLSTGEYSSAKAVSEKPAAPPAANAEVTITLKNNAEKSVAIFAGAKEDIREPKLMAVGGMSKNTLYVRINDVVCLMTVDKRPMACTSVKQGMTMVEVSTSANTLSSK